MLQTLLVVPGALLVIVCICPPLQQLVRKHVSPTVYDLVDRQIPSVVKVQRWHHPFLTLLVHLSAATVAVDFYLLSLPFLLWLGYCELTVGLVNGLALGTYVTSCLKDVLACPRPVVFNDPKVKSLRKDKAGTGDNVKVKVLENKDETENGAPSMHTSLSLIMNVHMVKLGLDLGLIPRPEYAALYYGACLLWSGWIAWTRMYLGMHTPIDLVLGAYTGLSFFGLWSWVCPYAINFMVERAAGTLSMLALPLVLLGSYPQPPTKTVSFMFGTTFLGAAFGGNLSYSGRLPIWKAVMPLLPGSVLNFLAGSAASRILFGYVFVFVTRLVVKSVLHAVMPLLLKPVPLRLRTLWVPPVAADDCKPGTWSKEGGLRCRPDGYPWDAYVYRTFITYAIVVYGIFEYRLLLGVVCNQPPLVG